MEPSELLADATINMYEPATHNRLKHAAQFIEDAWWAEYGDKPQLLRVKENTLGFVTLNGRGKADRVATRRMVWKFTPFKYDPIWRKSIESMFRDLGIYFSERCKRQERHLVLVEGPKLHLVREAGSVEAFLWCETFEMPLEKGSNIERDNELLKHIAENPPKQLGEPYAMAPNSE